MSFPEILETDVLFGDSPDAGDPDCLCSRCKLPIGEDDAPALRAWPEGGANGEYRFHRPCVGLKLPGDELLDMEPRDVDCSDNEDCSDDEEDFYEEDDDLL